MGMELHQAQKRVRSTQVGKGLIARKNDESTQGGKQASMLWRGPRCPAKSSSRQNGYGHRSMGVRMEL